MTNDIDPVHSDLHLFIFHFQSSMSAEPGLVCQVCEGGERFKLKEELTYHLMSHSVLQLAYALADLQFRLEEVLSSDISADVDQVSSPAPPRTAKTDFVRTEESEKKKVKKSSSRSPHTCQVCQRVLSSRGALAKHLVIHRDQKPFRCDQCHLQFNQNRDLKSHKMQKHTLQRPHVCGICAKGFVHKFYLMEHMNYHTGEREFQCNFCGKTFPAQSALTKHMKRHSTTRNFACHLCSKSFVVKKDLNVHVKLVHEKPRENRGIPARDSLDISFELNYPGEQQTKWPEGGGSDSKTEPRDNQISPSEKHPEPTTSTDMEKPDDDGALENRLLEKDWMEEDEKKRFLEHWMEPPDKPSSVPSNSESGETYIPNIPKLPDSS